MFAIYVITPLQRMQTGVRLPVPMLPSIRSIRPNFQYSWEVTCEPEKAGSTSPGSRQAATTDEYCRAIGRCSVLPGSSTARMLLTPQRLQTSNLPKSDQPAEQRSRPSCRQQNTPNDGSRQRRLARTFQEGTDEWAPRGLVAAGRASCRRRPPAFATADVDTASHV